MIFAVVWLVMNWTEIIIVYLAIGAPFGVYHFLKRREAEANLEIIGRSLAAILFWVFFAAVWLWQTAVERNAARESALDLATENKIAETVSNLEAIYSNSAAQTNKSSFFEFREMLARYVGLTEAWHESAPHATAFAHEIETLRVAKREKLDLQLGGRCIHRRNVMRLKTHQLRAAAEFLAICRTFADDQSFLREAVNLAEVLADNATALELKKLRKTPLAARQNAGREKSLWKTSNYELTANLKIKV